MSFEINIYRVATYGTWVYPGETLYFYQGNQTEIDIEGYGLEGWHRIAFIPNCTEFANVTHGTYSPTCLCYPPSSAKTRP